eukprot:TRINITY_DN9619_c0_g2_i1.p1 TRINITY_DN9619_c0_g2~~TRINITY_DN9619_c0_g2_i1.p1  ORF type:complete len:115 (-),score=22.79 TRINITY_DN9619_c0_g2_i1:38-382(-)
MASTAAGAGTASHTDEIVDKDDPRRPLTDKQLNFRINKQEEPRTDYYLLAALMFGMMALIFKYRIFVLQSVLCCVLSFTNSSSQFDVKQFISAVCLAFMGLFVAYVGPQARHFE